MSFLISKFTTKTNEFLVRVWVGIVVVVEAGHVIERGAAAQESARGRASAGGHVTVASPKKRSKKKKISIGARKLLEIDVGGIIKILNARYFYMCIFFIIVY